MSPIRSLYHWALRQAEKPYATWLLFFIAMIEPCLLPVPPDTLLLPMCIARRDKAYKFAAIATAGSVTGALIGYGIGSLAMATVGHWIVTTYGLQDKFEHFREAFHHYGVWIILLKGLTPIPFILVTVVSGMVHLNLIVFFISATITRGARFFLEAALIHRYGDPVRHFIEKYLNWVALGALAIILFGFWIILR